MDAEIEAMQKVAAALDALDPPARRRVLDWVTSRLGLTEVERSESGARAPTAGESGDFADLFHTADPQSHAERALVGAYWLSRQSPDPFASQTLNSLLKDLGFQVPNITAALTQNMSERPALVVQTKKGGSTRQARKLYKITDAGVRRIRSMIDSGLGDANGRN
jgi:hypothetical protein